MAKNTVLVALTGGIGSGKTEVTNQLQRRGAIIVDADQIARLVVEPGEPALHEIAAVFGPDVIGPSGELNRQALADVVFPDPAKLAQLNAITHPRIEERTRQMLSAAPANSVVVYAMPLLVESGQTQGWDLIAVVDAPDDVRLQRLVAQRGLPQADVVARMRAQVGRDERNAIADVILDNSGDRASLHAQVDDLWQRVWALQMAAGMP